MRERAQQLYEEILRVLAEQPDPIVAEAVAVHLIEMALYDLAIEEASRPNTSGNRQ